jgi:putative DNA primase/helicase
LERVSGSLAFGALARLVFGTVKQKADDDTAPSRYLLARVKSNIGPDGSGFAYAFEQADIGGGIIASRTAWGGEVQGSARDLLAEAEADPDDAGQDAASFLRDLLADGAMPTKEVFREAEGAGYSRDQVKRAKAKIGALAEKQGMTGGWSWRLSASEGSEKPAEGSEGSGQNFPHSSHPSGDEPHSWDGANGVEAFDL